MMSQSSATVLAELESGGRRLRELSANDPDVLVEPGEQLAIENAIAAGVAILAGEPLPPPAEPSGRSILARDLAITTDLVVRAMRAHGAV